MNAIALVPQDARVGRSLTAADVRAHVNLVQEVMQAVMKKDTHYGIIPGCKQPSLYKAGSEVLLSTFRIAVSVLVEDLSTPDCIRYRVRTVGTHQMTGVVVGEGIGECSSDEEKYKWRKCWNLKEFNVTPENRRRIKFSKFGEDMQVRTEPADMANTVLKMAKKRAQIDMTLTATAASDIFAQDLEDLPEGLIDPEPTPEEIEAQKLAARQSQHDAAKAKHSESVDFIKARLADNDDQAAVDEWERISEDDRRALWLAPSKGGFLTTDEQKRIRAIQGAAQAAAVRTIKDEEVAAADREISKGAPQ